MSEIKSPLGKVVFLTSTDTIAGFLSQDSEKLDRIKKRAGGKHYIVALPSLRTLRRHTRTPQFHKNRVRRSSGTTFIYPDKRSFRVIHDPQHLLLVERLGWAYSTSANLSGEEYDAVFAENAADIIIYPIKNRSKPSGIIMLGKKRAKRIR